MGDSLRETAFDDAYRVVGDVVLAEKYANETVARVRRSRRRLAALCVVTSVLLVIGATAAVARSGGDTKRAVRSAAAPPAAGVVEETTTPEATTTTAVLVQPPISTTPAVATPETPATTRTTRVRAPATNAPTTSPAKASVAPTAALAEVWPPSRDPHRVYVAARGRDEDAHVSRMTIDWGDGTQVVNIDYPPSACQVGEVQAFNANHAYSAPGSYTVRLIVTTVDCNGGRGDTATAQTPVLYPSSPPA